VVWGGGIWKEPIFILQDFKPIPTGRDHHPRSFNYLDAGGELNRGLFMETDDFGYNIVKRPGPIVQRFQATMLNLLGNRP